MKKKQLLTLVTLTVLSLAATSSALAVTEYDQNITPTVIFGSGVTDGAWTTERVDGLEIGLRSKLRYDGSCQPQNVFNSNGDGTYTYPAGDAGCGAPPKFVWSFEWSVNTDYDEINNPTGLKIDAYTYELGIDTDPSAGTSFCTWDPITPNTPPAGSPAWDHAIGDNSTGLGGGTIAGSIPGYATLINTNNVAQNSWRYDFFDVGSGFDPCGYVFDPDPDASYDIYLRVLDGGGAEVARTTIGMINGNGAPAPLPATGPIALIALVLGLGLFIGVRTLRS